MPREGDRQGGLEEYRAAVGVELEIVEAQQSSLHRLTKPDIVLKKPLSE